MSTATPAAAAVGRGVNEVLHFTTDRGVLGALTSGRLLSRARVEEDPEIAFIFTGVWPRRDPEWIDHVSMSLTEINKTLYARAAANLPDRWWAILSFDVEILDHEGVVFTTTNNVYEAVCERGEGAAALTAMFGDRVAWGYYGSVITRPAWKPANVPTDSQAEILYPGSVDLHYLRRIYVSDLKYRSLIRAWCDVLGCGEPAIDARPELF